jgi:HPt (histidine-containing phosphotransfer) domain-containing protein
MNPVPGPILDNEAIDNLRALGEPGDDTFLREIIGIYLEDVPKRIADLKTARHTGDTTLYSRSAHTIKGSSANVGTCELRLIAEQIELRAKTESLTDLDPLLAELNAAYARARSALLALLAPT